MTNFLFTVTVDFEDVSTKIPYGSIDECLSDKCLRTLFDDGLITACVIHCGDKRIAGLPVMDWWRFRDQIVSNSATLLRSMCAKAGGQ